MIIAKTPVIRFSSQELDAAAADWGCNCGPSALAACLEISLAEVRPKLGEFERMKYLNPTQMARSIRSFNRYFHNVPDGRLPKNGVVRVQWGGPWMLPPVPERARYRFTHWIGSKLIDEVQWIFDANAGWESLADWERGTAKRIMDHIKRADGTWTYTHRWDISDTRPGS